MNSSDDNIHMNDIVIIRQTTEHVKKTMYGEGTGHDWWHVYRVWNIAKKIAKTEKDADMEVVELGALLHDIKDWKFSNGDMKAGERAAREWLESIDADPEIVDRVCYIVGNVSFKGAGVKDRMKTLEGRIVQDADRIDAIGAIGIARCFAYGGHRNRQIYDPGIRPVLHKTFKAYKSSEGTSLNHFYEKLLLLKNRMHTKEGKRIADERNAFMQEYLDRFMKEWEGKK